MKINMIAAMSSNRVIGNNNQLPWHYSEDLQHFKTLTLDHIIVMGYNTFISIGKPLPKRRNIILTSKTIEGVETYTSIEDMMDKLTAEGISEIFIIGGASIYKQFIPLADTIYLTLIKKAVVGDTYFPIFEDQFDEVGREEHEEFDFVKYQKK